MEETEKNDTQNIKIPAVTTNSRVVIKLRGADTL